MFSYIRDFVRRHKKKVFITTGIVASSYFLSNYVSKKIEEFQKRLKEENFAKEQIKRRFKQTQSDCYMTFLSLLPVLTEPIYDELNVEEITRQLQAKRSQRNKSISSMGETNSSVQPTTAASTVLSDDFSTVAQQNENQIQESPVSSKSKTQLWIELKIQSITRLLTLLYCESLLIIFLHLQLNILSRKSYLETAIKLASKNNGIQLIDNSSHHPSITSDDSDADEEENVAEQAFLSFSWWLLNRGWGEIKKNVESSVEDVFGEINPRQEISIDEFGVLINKVQRMVDSQISKPIPNSSASAFSTLDASNFSLMNSSTQNDPSSSGGTTTALVNTLLPSKDLQFFLLQQTNDLDFLTKFNNDISNTERLDKLLVELTDYLNNDQIGSVVSLLVTVGISKVFDNIVTSLVEKEMSSPVKNSNDTNNENKITELPEPPKTKLASLLALITKQSNQLINNSLDNDILYALNNLPELDDLSASVYSNFDA